jgi:KDO2-lipid IV(A) lauroyltransferase
MAELAKVANRCLESVTMFAVEAICLPRLITPFTWSRYVRLVNFEETLRLILEGHGLVMVTGHYGSFELMGHLLAALRFPVAAVMRPFDNVYLNRFIVASRRTHGLMLLDKFGATTQAEQLLQEGTLLGFIGDQDAGRKGMFVEFFGQPASTYKSIGLLAMSANVPIVVGYARRRGNQARYDVGAQRIIYPHEWEHQEDPLRWITQEYSTAIEQMVRDAPEQYLWIHRRWKSKPKGKGTREQENKGSRDGGIERSRIEQSESADANVK